jgi:hypothetical protein
VHDDLDRTDAVEGQAGVGDALGEVDEASTATMAAATAP